MTAPLVVSIPHRLGKQEAVRRLKAGLGQAGLGQAALALQAEGAVLFHDMADLSGLLGI